MCRPATQVREGDLAGNPGRRRELPHQRLCTPPAGLDALVDYGKRMFSLVVDNAVMLVAVPVVAGLAVSELLPGWSHMPGGHGPLSERAPPPYATL